MHFEGSFHHSTLLVPEFVFPPPQLSKYLHVAVCSVHVEGPSHLNAIGSKEGIELELIC